MTAAESSKEYARETWPLGFRAAEAGGVPSDRIKKLLNWIAGQPNVPHELANTIGAEIWLEQVVAFRQTEEIIMLAGNYERDLAVHRVILTDLIAQGESVIFAIRKSGMLTPPTNFTVEDLQSTLNSLHTTFRCEHGPKNSQKTNDLIAKLFDGSKP